MYLNVFVIVVVLFIAYMWAAQGLFSSLLHLLCTVVAGAVAFGVWEPLVNNFLLGMRQDIAWGVGLLGPFVITLAALRFATDRLIPANLDLDQISNFVGGAVFGLGSGLITAGMLVISFGFMSTSVNFLGFQRVDFDRTGSVVADSSLWIPADRLTTDFYEFLSTTGFSTPTPLAVRHPDVDTQAGAIRLTFDDSSRNTLLRSDFEIVGKYQVTAPTLRELTQDSFSVTDEGDPLPQQVVTIEGQAPPNGSTIHGYTIRFLAGAREDHGQIVIGPGQMRLICRTDEDSAIAVHPSAVISQAEGASRQAARFRFDAPDVYVASVGGANESTMAFEFIVPPGAQPVDLLVKNIRVPVRRVPDLAAAPEDGFDPMERDQAIRQGALLQGETAELDTSDATVVTTPPDQRRDPDFEVSNRLGRAFNVGSRGSLQVDEDNQITGGRHTLSSDAFGQGINRDLRVESFRPAPGTEMVKVNIALDSKLSIFGRSLQMAQDVLPPTLIDTIGQRYQAIGYIYTESSGTEIRYTPGDPLRGLREIPTLSRSRPDQQLQLLFLVSEGVEISTFALGNKAMYEFDPPKSI